MWNYTNLFKISSAVSSGSSQYININHNCIKYFGWCGLLEQCTQRENSCLGFDFCGRYMAPVNRTKQGPWPDIMLSAKARASEPYRDRRRDSLISEIPRGMQPGLLSFSRCGRWIGAHQWLTELISLAELETVPHYWGCWVVECAWVCRLKVLTAGLLLTLLMHARGLTDYTFIPAQ